MKHKKIGIGILLFMCCLLFSSFSVSAQGSSLTFEPASALSSSSETSSKAEEATLRIDSDHQYENMNKTYKAGYTPSIVNGKAVVVLPLISSGTIKRNEIIVTPDFGEGEKSPFEAVNMQKTITLKKHTLVNGKEQSAYLVTFSFPLSPDRSPGKYPLVFHVNYEAEGIHKEQKFTVYVSIPDGAGGSSEPQKDEEKPLSVGTDKPQSKPKLILDDYIISPSPVEAGKPFTIEIDLHNTSLKQTVYNIKASIKTQSNDVIPSEKDGVQYISSIGKNGHKTLLFSMKVRPDAKPEPQKLSLEVEYEDKNAAEITASFEIVLELKQQVHLETDTLNIPKTMNAGDTVLVSLGVFNMGKGKVSNVMCKLDVPGLIPEESVFLGNMESGEGKNAEFSLFVGTKDMVDDQEISPNSAPDELYGMTAGKIIITYEDEFGETYRKEIQASTEIQEPYVPQSDVSAAPEVNPMNFQWWGVIVLLGAMLLVGGIIIILKRKKNEMSRMMDDVDD